MEFGSWNLTHYLIIAKNYTMKHIISGCLLMAVIIVTACGGDKKKTEPAPPPAAGTETPKPADPADLSADPVYAEGLGILKRLDCLTCHTETRKINGPTYEEVAAKYDNTPENVSMLAEKVIKGIKAGTGVWGGTVDMVPHPSLSKEDAEKIIKYIFKLKK